MVATTLFQLPKCREDKYLWHFKIYFTHHKFGKTFLQPIRVSIYKNVLKYQSNRKTLENFWKVCKSLRKTWNDSSNLFHCVCTLYIQCNLDLVTLNLVTTCDLVTILQRPFFNLLHKIIRFSDSFCGDQKCH